MLGAPFRGKVGCGHRWCSIVELLEEVNDWCGWIPMCSHAIKIGCEVRGGDGSVFSIYVSEKSKRFTLTKLGGVMF